MAFGVLAFSDDIKRDTGKLPQLGTSLCRVSVWTQIPPNTVAPPTVCFHPLTRARKPLSQCEDKKIAQMIMKPPQWFWEFIFGGTFMKTEAYMP